jgi:hypothetical protein
LKLFKSYQSYISILNLNRLILSWSDHLVAVERVATRVKDSNWQVMNCLRGGGGATWSWHPISHLLSIDEKRGEKGEWKGRERVGLDLAVPSRE